MTDDFLIRISKIIEDNLSNEQFGVSELAREAAMSRSNLLRKVKKLTKISASQFIREVRLKNAMGMLRQTSLTVSEISFKVGFGSLSYFIKCFRDYYGYPPGEVGKREQEEVDAFQMSQSSQSHQLAAIMFTDIQGYTALMQQDEVKAVGIRNRHREIFNAITRKFDGRILQYYGDGTLSTFHSAVEAVRCGIELQRAFREEPRIPVRIGIHSGDIIFAEDGIIGDGVNIASRVESLATAGSVFISEKVYDEVKNQPGIQTLSMGKFEMKNVNKPVEVFAIANAGLVIPGKEQISGKIINGSFGSRNAFHTKGRTFAIKWVLITLVLVTGGYILYNMMFKESPESVYSPDQNSDEKSIAVLPFINDSNDSSNVYFINGLMESTLNNLQKIKDLRVISRTSVERYRNHPESAPEIARRLRVNYLIEGSGQKIGDRILLHIQLIDARNDKHLWTEQYDRETGDIFKIQVEIARNITEQIRAIITPEEEDRINKLPTRNLAAYDTFLKGLDLLYTRTPENLEKAIDFFQQAITQDGEFARAYAASAIAYYFLDENKTDKKYSDRINYFADQALLHDEQLPQSLVAKALYYVNTGEYEFAASYFEKALEYNPNYDLALSFLVPLYAERLPDTEKYLTYALRGIKLDLSSYDSLTASYIFMHISNAFIQSGFINEALSYIDQSLLYFPRNLYSSYIKAYILYAKNKDLRQTRKLLTDVYRKDSTRVDIVQETAKICYYLRDYKNAYRYYKKFLAIKDAQDLNIYNGENAKIGYVFSRMGRKDESEKYFNEYLDYAEEDQTLYRHLSLAAYYSYHDEKDRALEQMRLFSAQDNYPYWIIIFTPIDPLFDNIRDIPEFSNILREMEKKFRRYHESVRKSLEGKGLL